MSSRRKLATPFFAAAVFLLLSSSPGGAVPPTPVPDVKPDLSSMSFYIGTWTCHQNLRGSDRPNTTTYAMALDERWISSNDVAPAFDKYRTKTIFREGRFTYNPLMKQWVNFHVDSFGNYDMSTSPGWDGSQIIWTDTVTSDGSMGKFTVTKVSDTELHYLYVSHDKDGKANPEDRAVCKKSS